MGAEEVCRGDGLGSGWLIYHPKRQLTQVGEIRIYHDSFSGNQDPYVWSRRFLHTACHMSQMSPRIGDINFWVSGDVFPAFTRLWCDLVFVVADKVYWTEPNNIECEDPMVDSAAAFADHYAWMPIQHPYRRRRRFTLKADSEQSFQPQGQGSDLIDILPYLKELGLPLEQLRLGLTAGYGSKPLPLPHETASALYEDLVRDAAIRHSGHELEAMRNSVEWPFASAVL